MIEALVDHLHERGVGFKGQDLFAFTLPDLPDNVITLLPYEGASGGWRDPTGLPTDALPRCQIRVRGATEQWARGKAGDAFKALHVRHRRLSGIYFMQLEALQTPFFLRRDERGRTEYAFNVEAWHR